MHKVTKLFDLRTGEANWTQVPEHEMVVRALGLEAVAVRHELLGNSLRVSTHLLGVLLERRVGGLLEGHGNAGNSVVVGATLACRENSSVYAGLQISLAVLAEENEAGTRATQRLVRRRRDNITVLKRTVLLLASNKTRDVGHVAQQVSTVLLGDLMQGGVFPVTGVSRATAHEQTRLVQVSVNTKTLVVNVAVVALHLVRERLEVNGRSSDPLLRSVVTMRQVATIRQAKTHDAVVGLDQCREGSKVGRRA